MGDHRGSNGSKSGQAVSMVVIVASGRPYCALQLNGCGGSSIAGHSRRWRMYHDSRIQSGSILVKYLRGEIVWQKPPDRRWIVRISGWVPASIAQKIVKALEGVKSGGDALRHRGFDLVCRNTERLSKVLARGALQPGYRSTPRIELKVGAPQRPGYPTYSSTDDHNLQVGPLIEDSLSYQAYDVCHKSLRGQDVVFGEGRWRAYGRRLAQRVSGRIRSQMERYRESQLSRRRVHMG